jgi:hypothetical protein
MKKRLTDADKWEDEWFAELPPKYKLFWQYILDRCDIAGVWKVNFRLANFQTSEHFQRAETLAAFDGRIKDIGKDRWWVKGFVSFQYPTLSDKSAVHRRVMQVIDMHGLSPESGLGSGSRSSPESGPE